MHKILSKLSVLVILIVISLDKTWAGAYLRYKIFKYIINNLLQVISKISALLVKNFWDLATSNRRLAARLKIVLICIKF